MRRLLALALLLSPPVLAAEPALRSTPDLGKAEGQCRPNESGPALLVTISGLKDRRGNLKAELYPANDDDFLADDNLLVMAGKTFRRVEVPVPHAGAVELCIRVPGPGTYALSVLHDRDGNRKFGLSSDGFGVPGNPAKFCFSKPGVETARVSTGAGVGNVVVRMNYRSGLFCFAPVKG
ncbi:MAG: hypothetical protein CFE37_07625 [Alphaproteobacteria bacterium PA4]|nr:MAG: hypothetical protein CFE37_07625 [Alphaproteobacteria bacterium PA4]